MASIPTSKMIGAGIGARGGSRTGHRSGVRPRSAFVHKSKASSASVGTKEEQQDVIRPRSLGIEALGVGQLDTQTEALDKNAGKSMEYKTASSHPHHSPSSRRQQNGDPTIARHCNAFSPHFSLYGCDGTSGIMHGRTSLSTLSSDRQSHGIEENTDDNYVCWREILSQTSTGPIPEKIRLVKRISNMRNLDKNKKKMKTAPDHSANDDIYIGLAAEGDFAKLHGYSGTDSIYLYDLTEPADNSSFSVYRPLTESSRQRHPQSSAASTRSVVTTRSAATTQSTASTNSSNAATYSGFNSQHSLATNEKNTNYPSDDEQSDGDDNEPSKPLQASVPRFACPFRRHDPVKYSGGSCANSSWDKISRMKEHLYRRHTRICQRCRYAFPSKKELDSHASQAGGCKPRTGATEGVTDDIERRLKIRKKYSSNQSDGECWEEIYRILFPDDDSVPWPYVETNQHEPSSLFYSRALANIKKHLQLKLQHLVQNGEETQNLGEDRKGELLLNMHDCVEEVFAEHEASGGRPKIPIDTLADPSSLKYGDSKTINPSGPSLFQHEQVNETIISTCPVPSDQHMSVLFTMQDACYPSQNTAPPNANAYSDSCDEIGAMQCSSNLDIPKHNYSAPGDREMPYERINNSNYNNLVPQDFDPNIIVEAPLEEPSPWYNNEGSMRDITFGTEMSGFGSSGFHESANEGIEEQRWG